MGKKQDKVASEFRNATKNSILRVQEVLEENNPQICVNPQVLKKAVSDLSTPGPDGRTSWWYKVVNLEFNVSCRGKRQPDNTPDRLKAILDIQAQGDTLRESHDPFTFLELNITVECQVGERTHMDTWHFDRHQEDEGSKTPDEAHPLYHLQRGGYRMTDVGNEVGRTLVLEAPRVAHPPLDLILAIDYLISNYSGPDWRNLRRSTEYVKAVKHAQVKFWRPFSETWNSHFEQPGDRPLANAQKLIPSLV